MARRAVQRTGNRPSGVALPAAGNRLIPVFALGSSLAVFFMISYALCVLFYLWFPEAASGHAVLTLFLPGFKLLTWQSFLLGLVESFAYGWYIALVFGPIYNFCVARLR
jgi:hypothetical protein